MPIFIDDLDDDQMLRLMTDENALQSGSNSGAVMNEVAAVTRRLIEGVMEDGTTGTIVPAVQGQLSLNQSKRHLRANSPSIKLVAKCKNALPTVTAIYLSVITSSAPVPTLADVGVDKNLADRARGCQPSTDKLQPRPLRFAGKIEHLADLKRAALVAKDGGSRDDHVAGRSQRGVEPVTLEDGLQDGDGKFGGVMHGLTSDRRRYTSGAG